MTAADAVWIVGTVLFVAGCLGMAYVWWLWRYQPTARLLHTSDGPMVVRGPADALKHVRVVQSRRPPYDWARDGD